MNRRINLNSKYKVILWYSVMIPQIISSILCIISVSIDATFEIFALNTWFKNCHKWPFYMFINNIRKLKYAYAVSKAIIH